MGYTHVCRKRLNEKGFTLVELLATIVILALVMGIGSYTITNVIKSSREKDYELLIGNIKDSLELYYQECKYASNSEITCNIGYLNGVDTFTTTLGDLISYGFLKGNGTNQTERSVLVNPLDKNDISGCSVECQYSGGMFQCKNISDISSCPELD